MPESRILFGWIRLKKFLADVRGENRKGRFLENKQIGGLEKMGKKRSPERDRAMEIYLKSKGKLTPREVAAKVGISPDRVRRWKYEDKWDELLKRPHRGAPAGNRNAAGHGAPKGNTNAETHGAYSYPRRERLTEEERAEIDGLEAAFDGNALRSLQRLEAKRADLEKRIAVLQEENGGEEEKLYLDRVMKMDTPEGEMEYRTLSSAFSRRMVLEAELNRVDGRIIKLLDSLKSNQAERERIAIEKKRLAFAMQKAAGRFEVDENGDIVPEADEEDDGMEIVDV